MRLSIPRRLRRGKGDREGRPYNCKGKVGGISRASVAGRQPFCRYATFPLTGEFHTGPPLQLLSYVSVIVQNVAKTAKPPPQSAKADSFFWRKRQPFCHFVTFPLTGEFPVTSDGGGFKWIETFVFNCSDSPCGCQFHVVYDVERATARVAPTTVKERLVVFPGRP